jgi:hypothetical protein
MPAHGETDAFIFFSFFNKCWGPSVKGDPILTSTRPNHFAGIGVVLEKETSTLPTTYGFQNSPTPKLEGRRSYR